jgi:hypothetical protein
MYLQPLYRYYYNEYIFLPLAKEDENVKWAALEPASIVFGFLVYNNLHAENRKE